MREGDVRRALSSLGSDALCPVCMHDIWRSLGDAENDRDIKLVALDESGELLERADRPGPPWLGLICAVLICRQCGWVRLPSVGALQRLLDAAA